MHVLVDLTNSPHVPLFAPLVRRMRADGHEVTIAARRFAQTVELCEMHGLDAEVIGSHGGATRLGKARAAAGRTARLLAFARRAHKRRRIDIGVSHGSTDLPVVCRMLRVPHVTMFDYEWARTMHRLNCRASWRVLTPDAIPPDRLDEYGAGHKLRQYEGLKEEYYLHDVDLDERVRAEYDPDGTALLAVMRPPPELALYHRGHHNQLFGAILDRIVDDATAVVVMLPRTPEQREALKERARTAGPGKIIVPDNAIDAQSLVAAADLVISAGGTMNREAVALGTPVYTVFAGRMGAVDERLIAEGRMQQIEHVDDVRLERRAQTGRSGATTLRDPAVLIDHIVDGVPTLDDGTRRR